MIENIILNEINNKFYRINIKEGDLFKNLNLKLENCNIPFGIEEYSNKYYLNFEANNNEEYIKLVRLLEKNLSNLLETTEEYELKSVFHKKPKYNLLCKCHIKKNNNCIISKYIKNNIETSIFELEKKKSYKIELEISGIWIYRKTYGLVINIIKIF